MNDALRFETLAYLGLFLLIAALSILARILPLSVASDAWPRPDILIALTMAWVLRRPAHMPAIAIVLVFLAEDLFLMRPPGLWALLMLVGTEFLRRRQPVVRDMNLLLEWGLVASVMVTLLVANRLGLMIVMTPRPPLDLSLLTLVFTMAAYPLVVLVLQGLLRVRKPATGEVDERGHRI
ncbi:rod shape-determining protein MreD [Pararhodobacter oceanensis]|uniref:Rod shape-determining protein MreD n=1 Tax=Pararhodobacter oceanensis TaxID=2172121 RepID=A0A2T8HU69_9RHOB|nr:rod shape-determining protein MreD [Pararhodobacter oceanensis]PVH29007.1 rod shape-determining protein MreD [Pararhodobacter oceanensis]